MITISLLLKQTILYYILSVDGLQLRALHTVLDCSRVPTILIVHSKVSHVFFTGTSVVRCEHFDHVFCIF